MGSYCVTGEGTHRDHELRLNLETRHQSELVNEWLPLQEESGASPLDSTQISQILGYPRLGCLSFVYQMCSLSQPIIFYLFDPVLGSNVRHFFAPPPSA